MYGHLAPYRKLRHLTLEELDSLREEWPWVTDPLDSLPLDTRPFNCLLNGEIFFLGELVQHTEWELLRLKNFGWKSLKTVRNLLAERGFQLGMRLADSYSELLVFPRGAFEVAPESQVALPAPPRRERYLTPEELERLSDKWPWLAESIDDLPLDVRTHHSLRRGDIVFLGELVQRTEWELLRLKNFGRKSLKLVKFLLAERGLYLDIRLADRYSELLVLPRDALDGLPEPPVVIPAPRTAAEELLHAGILPTTSWHECLDVKFGTAHILLTNDLEHVGDVLEQVRDGRLSAATMSPEWFEDLLGAFGKLGIGPERSGPLPATDLPQSLPVLCELAVAQLAERHAAVLIRHYLFGESLTEIAEEWLVSRSRIHQLRDRAVKRVLRPIKKCIEARTKALADALDLEGVLSPDRVFELAGCRDMKYIVLALVMSGRGGVRVGRDGGLCRGKRPWSKE